MNDIDKPENNPEFTDIKCISPNLASDDYLQLMHLDFSDFEWKKVASIWWWFGILEMDLARQWTEVEIIDPVYKNEESIQEAWQKTYIWFKENCDRRSEDNGIIENRIIEVKQEIEKMERKIADLFNWSNSDKWKFDELYNNLDHKWWTLKWLKERKDGKAKLFKNKEILLRNLNRWKAEKPDTLIFNPSSWQEIRDIPESSKDYVFINHTLSYFPNEIDRFLEQADKILKDWWTIFIVDYVDKLSELQDFFRKNWTYNILWWTFCGSLKKWEFKNFGK